MTTMKIAIGCSGWELGGHSGFLEPADGLAI
jgi:hypothetical protein